MKYNKNIKDVTFATNIPMAPVGFATGFSWEEMEAGKAPSWPMISADHDYVNTLNIEIIDGENYSEDMQLNINPHYILKNDRRIIVQPFYPIRSIPNHKTSIIYKSQ